MPSFISLCSLCLCTVGAHSSPGIFLRVVLQHRILNFPSIHQAIAVCHRCLNHQFPELGALYSKSKEWQGVKQQQLYLSLSFFISQLDQFYNLQKTPRLEGSCQRCSGTAHLDRLLKFCLLAGEKRRIQTTSCCWEIHWIISTVERSICTESSHQKKPPKIKTPPKRHRYFLDYNADYPWS